MTLSIELDDHLAQELAARARQLDISASELATLQIRRFLETPSDVADDAEFEAVAHRAIARDAELLRRLAQ